MNRAASKEKMSEFMKAAVQAPRFNIESDVPLPEPPGIAPEILAIKDWCLARANEWYKMGLSGQTVNFS